MCENNFKNSKQLEIAIQALNDIIDPVNKLRRNLKEGELLNGLFAIQIMKDPSYLRSIASNALLKINDV